MSKTKLLPFALLALSHGVFAQQPPSAGSQMQQIPPQSLPQSLAPRFEVRQASAPASPAADSARIRVQSLRVTGAQVYSEDILLATTGFRPGSELSLTELRTMAARIADFYHRNGYFVAQAYLPAQDIQNGALRIAVIEGHYGKVVLRNQTPVSESLAAGLLGGLNSGDPITVAPLESRLLLLSDLPGVKVQSTLVPGSTLGASDLIVDVLPGRRVTGSVDADNAGNRYTGQNRLGATINVNEPAGHGDVATLRVLTAGPGLHYARAAYQMQFGKARAGIAYSHLGYELGREFESLHAHGTARTASVYGSYPLIRSRDSNLYAGLVFDERKFQDRVDTTASVTDKKARVLTASLYGDARDTLGAGGATSYSLALSAGRMDLQTPVLRDYDALTARTGGSYNKLAFSLARLQGVTGAFSVYAGLNGQIASKNLDISEKMELGGMYGVRAYPEGEAYADQGYLLTLEARLQLPKFSASQAGEMQLVAFADTGTVTLNKQAWVAGNNRRTLSGAGVGLNWTVPNDWMVRAYYARKLGSGMATSAPDKSGRFWIQAVKYF
jgi:hemolysin activation/secretion protein